MIDEGKIISVVERRVADAWLVSVVRTPTKGGKFRPELGLNFPTSTMHLPPLSTKDLSDLDHITRIADIVGYSFVQEPQDLDRLHDELDARFRNGRRLGISIKIETARAVRNLPELIVHGAGRRPLAVMIARGDLAVELGYERLAEMQEEILWLAEAAHVPVTWATQVLERLVKKGTPSRAEITDAAMAVRAECVMLNKGPHIINAVSILDDVLTRMQEHQSKKTPQLRALRSWGSPKS
jgi:pyruvate kinase